MNAPDYSSRFVPRRVLFPALLMVLGLFFMVYGGYDDSPGGQLLGLLVAVFGLVRLMRSVRRS